MGVTLKVGTRGSRLALAQSEMVVRQLQKAHPRAKFKIVPIRTTGDRLTTATELRHAGKGVFVKEIERELLGRRISMAVHSMKDLPSELPEGLVIGAVLERADASDAFIGRDNSPIETLRAGSQIGTSSLRRAALLKNMYPFLRFVELRGNLDTRLEKLKSPRSNLSGIVVAAAGLERLGVKDAVVAQLFPRDRVVPAAGQGAIGIEIREADEATREFLEPIHHAVTAACVEAEREVLRRLEGGCQVPMGAHAESSEEGLIRLTVAIATVDGRRVIRHGQTGTIEDPRSVAEAMETVLNGLGAREILATFRRPMRRPARSKARSRR